MSAECITSTRAELDNMQTCLTLKWAALWNGSSLPLKMFKQNLGNHLSWTAVEGTPSLGEAFLKTICLEYCKEYCISFQLLPNILGGLKQHNLLSHGLWGSMHSFSGSSTKSHRLAIEMLAEMHSYLEAWLGKNLFVKDSWSVMQQKQSRITTESE